VRDALERGALTGPPLRTGRRHHDLLVPGEEHRHPLEVGDLGEAGAQLDER
jgi:hypothetical protein